VSRTLNRAAAFCASAAIFAAISVPAQAQSIATLNGENSWFSRPSIDTCAHQPLPVRPEDNAAYGLFEIAWRNVMLCRVMLDARHAGYVEAGGKDDPCPPVARMPGDMEVPFKPRPQNW
jgi:hypothetical protein